jgi:hypothetical protein
MRCAIDQHVSVVAQGVLLRSENQLFPAHPVTLGRRPSKARRGIPGKNKFIDWTQSAEEIKDLQVPGSGGNTHLSNLTSTNYEAKEIK